MVMKTTMAKITLSDNELELVCNTEWILTKQRIIQKVYDLYGGLVPQLEESLRSRQPYLPVAIFSRQAKISKGENYLQLPYVMLDYPRCFSGTDVAAIRCFFWWGNYFSVNLQLAGSYLDERRALVQQHFKQLAAQDFSICIADSPWHHHFNPDNFKALKSFSEDAFNSLVQKAAFVKIAKKISLHQWEEVPEFIVNSYEELAMLLTCDQAPSR